MLRKYDVVNGKIKITDTTETILESKDIEAQLQNIGKEKLKLLEQNRLTFERYKSLLAEEQQLQQIITEAGSSRLKLIDPDTGEELIPQDGEL